VFLLFVISFPQAVRPKKMRWLKTNLRILAGLSGLLLLLTGLYYAYWWFYELEPARHTLDPQWVAGHSQQEFWREVQTGIHRGVWLHDDGFHVGVYGDKSWAEWIMNHVQPGTSMSCLGGYPQHSATAMQFITNQDVGEDADPWLDWWEKNKSKSQEEWIADGFVQRGVKIGVPPTFEQILVIVALLANSDATDPASVPRYVRYNAFRYLRDTGFDPVEFALSHRTISGGTERGLVEYANWNRRYPEAIGLGILSLRKKDANNDGARAELVTPEFQTKANARVFVPLAVGTALLVWSFRNRKAMNGG
jgi:hypothetical protein